MNVVGYEELRESKRLTVDLPFRPEYIFDSTNGIVLVQEIVVGEGRGLPPYITAASALISTQPDLHVVILCRDEDGNSAKPACRIAEACHGLGYGLAFTQAQHAHLVFPPRYTFPKAREYENELGHIPSWMVERVLSSSSISDRMRVILNSFKSRYERLLSDGEPSTQDESRILSDLAHDIAIGDRRMFFPLDRIPVLREFEVTVGDPSVRDHAFHTFNDFLLGLLVLSNMLPAGGRTAIPDSYINVNPSPQSLHTWEVLWALTALFHDPGYLGEKPWSTFRFALGMSQEQGDNSNFITVDQAQAIDDAWETHLGEVRLDLWNLYNLLSQNFVPGAYADLSERFMTALRAAYFDGSKIGHSVISGLTLINRCKNDSSRKHPDFDLPTTRTASIIAALAMLFHDPRARAVLVNGGVPAVSYEHLPYASVLMFADALQDDRRDIGRSRYPEREVLLEVDTDSTKASVIATVSLIGIPIKYWPTKIAEYIDVCSWINSHSQTRFAIDYWSEAKLWRSSS